MSDLWYRNHRWMDVTHPEAEDDDRVWTTVTLRQQIPEIAFQYMEIKRYGPTDDDIPDRIWQVTVWQVEGIGAIPVYRSLRRTSLNSCFEDPIIKRAFGGNRITKGDLK